jgi:hypothetical protein
MPYRDWQMEVAPPWLRHPQDDGWHRAMGDAKDSLVELLRQGVKARFVTLAPPDALAALGQERGLLRLAGESDASFAGRIQAAWDSWQWAGTPFGLLFVLKGMGFSGAAILTPDREALGKGLMHELDGQDALVSTPLPARKWFATTELGWNHYELLLRPPLPAGWPVADESSEANVLRSVLTAWGSGHAKCNRVVVYSSGQLFGYPVRTFGAAGTFDGGAVVSYLTPP